MPSLACLVCHTTTEPLTESGLCPPCQSQTDETKAPLADDAAAVTVTRDPALDTVTAGDVETADTFLPPGGYEYLDELGEGGMGKVWRAVRQSTGQTVAIKKLHADCFTPSGLRRFTAEAKAVGLIDHPNVVRLLDFVPDPADPYLVLEYVHGPNLAYHLRDVGPLHPRRAARLGVQIAEGVQAAHDKGIVHRDLKPNNVILTIDGRVKVTDFGLVKTVAEARVPVAAGGGADDDTDDDTGMLTHAGQSAGGTPGFMAPEQADASVGPIDCRADVWGLGACLFSLLLGRPPFPVGKDNMKRVLTDPTPVPHEVDPSVPRDLSAIISKCLRKKPGERYSSVSAVAADLNKYLAGEPTTVNPLPWAKRQWRRVTRVPAGWWVAAAMVLLAVGTGVGLAMVPKVQAVAAAPPPAITPEMIQDEYRAELRAGNPVTLIGPTGFPRHHLWRLGSSTLVASWHDDGACAFEAVGPTLLELFDDPGIDRYIVRVEVRHLSTKRQPVGGPERQDGHMGLYICFAHTPNGRGEGVITLLRLTYTDYDPDFNRTNQLTMQNARSASAVCFTGPNRERSFPMVAHAMSKFVPAEKRPGEWRTLEYEVDGGRLIPRFGATGPATPMAPVVLNAAEEYARTQVRVDAAWPNAGVKVPAWTPRAPLGVFCDSAGVSIRNLVIVPLPPRPLAPEPAR